MSKFKKINTALLVGSIVLWLGIYYYWTSCTKFDCPVSLIDNLISPLQNTSVVLGLFFLFFLLLPAHYFEAWLKRVFSWAFPVAFITVLGTQDSGSVMSVSKADVVILNGIFWGVVTLFFVLYRRWKLKGSIVAGK